MPHPPTSRHCPDRPLPPYAYAPGRTPHPLNHPNGHGCPGTDPADALRQPEAWREDAAYLHGVDLYHAGFYWEAHEAWEGLWRQAERGSAQWSFLKGLIQLSAACLHLANGNSAGFQRLAEKGLRRLAACSGGVFMGLDVARFAGEWRAFAASAPVSLDDRPIILLIY